MQDEQNEVGSEFRQDSKSEQSAQGRVVTLRERLKALFEKTDVWNLSETSDALEQLELALKAHLNLANFIEPAPMRAFGWREKNLPAEFDYPLGEILHAIDARKAGKRVRLSDPSYRIASVVARGLSSHANRLEEIADAIESIREFVQTPDLGLLLRWEGDIGREACGLLEGMSNRDVELCRTVVQLVEAAEAARNDAKLLDPTSVTVKRGPRNPEAKRLAKDVWEHMKDQPKEHIWAIFRDRLARQNIDRAGCSGPNVNRWFREFEADLKKIEANH